MVMLFYVVPHLLSLLRAALVRPHLVQELVAEHAAVPTLLGRRIRSSIKSRSQRRQENIGTRAGGTVARRCRQPAIRHALKVPPASALHSNHVFLGNNLFPPPATHSLTSHTHTRTFNRSLGFNSHNTPPKETLVIHAERFLPRKALQGATFQSIYSPHPLLPSPPLPPQQPRNGTCLPIETALSSHRCRPLHLHFPCRRYRHPSSCAAATERLRDSPSPPRWYSRCPRRCGKGAARESCWRWGGWTGPHPRPL